MPKTSTKTRLTDLKRQQDELLAEAEIRVLQRAIETDEHARHLVESVDMSVVSDRIDAYSHYGTNVGGTIISRPQDRKDGDNYPFWTTEYEIAQIRGISRYLASVAEVGFSAIDTLSNYVIGAGLQRDISSPDPALQRKAEAILQEFDDRNQFCGDLDVEMYKRSIRDGESFLWLRPCGSGRTEAVVIEPDCVTEPAQPGDLEEYHGWPSMNWKYGVATEGRNHSKALAYFIEWFGDSNDWDAIPATDMMRKRRNVDRGIKRGMSDFFPTYENIQRDDKLLANIAQSAAVQASIAGIRKHAQGTSNTSMQSVQSALATLGTNAVTGNAEYQANINPGQILDTKNFDWAYGPIGTPGGSNFLPITNSLKKQIGIRWHMPEYMITSDAANGNFSSTLVAESPFVRFIEREQSAECTAAINLYYRVLHNAAIAGRLPCEPNRVRDYINIDVIGPEIETRDAAAEHVVLTGQYEHGVIDKDTWRAKAGYDPEKIKEKIETEGPKTVPFTEQIDAACVCCKDGWEGYP